jgi:hypothetical protein
VHPTAGSRSRSPTSAATESPTRPNISRRSTLQAPPSLQSRRTQPGSISMSA